MSLKHLLIAGGGTGGHIAPAIATGIEASTSFRVSYACTPRPVDALMYARFSDVLHVMNPPRLDKGMKILLPFTASRSFFAARSLLKSASVDVVLGTGGYSSFFAIAAAKSLGVPAALFESNAFPGRSNRMASRFCEVAFTGLPGCETRFNCRSIYTGTPISSEMKRIPASAAKKAIGIPEDKPVLLFLGGSQGARAINDSAIGLRGDVSILLQSGKRDYERVLDLIKDRNNIEVKSFVSDLSLWYSAADLVVARAGGQTIAELAAFGVPAVFVPYPYAAEDHQTANASVIEKLGGALMVPEEETKKSDFEEKIFRLIDNREYLARMSEAMKSIFPAHPAKQIVAYLQEMLR